MNKVPDFKLESKSRFFHQKDKDREQPSIKMGSKEKRES